MKKYIGFASYPDYSGNSKALFEDMKSMNIEKYDLIWFCKEKNIADRLNKNGINAIWDKSASFKKEFDNVKIMINTHDYYMDIKNDNQIFINLWHGLGLKKAGAFLENEIDWNFELSSKNDYLIGTSEFGRMVFSSIFSMPLYRVKQYPQARYKWLFENNGKSNLSKILKKDLSIYNKIIMYAPTFKSGLGRDDATINTNNVLNLNNYVEQKLIEFLEKNNILLVVKLHPSEQNKIKEIQTNNIIELKDEDMLNEFITINEVLDGIDLLISDYSSIYVDYINLTRPVLFLNTDKEEYIKNRGIIFNSLDFWWMAGPKVHDIDMFIIETEKLLNDGEYYNNERKLFNELVNGNEQKNNDKLIEFILNLEKTEIGDTSNYQTALLEKKNIQLKDEINSLKNENNVLINENNCIREEYNKIIYSRSYKTIQKIKRVIKRK